MNIVRTEIKDDTNLEKKIKKWIKIRMYKTQEKEQYIKANSIFSAVLCT
jgi:hypothetical protein